VNRITAPILVTVDAKPGEPDPAVRLKRWLKIGLRTFGIRAEWAPAETAKNDIGIPTSIKQEGNRDE
jgi:hypothetical protein